MNEKIDNIQNVKLILFNGAREDTVRDRGGQFHNYKFALVSGADCESKESYLQRPTNL